MPVEDHYVLALEGVALGGEDHQLVSAFAARVAHGLRVVRSVRDASQLRELAEVEVTRSGLMRAVSTDLSGSLEAIQFKVTSLLDGGVTAPVRVQRERLLAVESEVQRLSRIVNNLVDLGRLETHSVVVRPSRVTVASLVTHALAAVDTRPHPLDVDVASDLPTLSTDPRLAQRCLEIFITNACRFAPPATTLRINAGVADQWMEILVIDRGPGVSTRDLADLRHLAGRIDPDRGAPLGLSVAKGFAELLRGELRLEDTPGGGLTAILALPLEDAATA